MHCLHYPHSVSAAFKLLVDGLARYNKYLKKVDDLFFNILMIDFHYSMTLDEALLSKLHVGEDPTSKIGKNQTTVFVTNSLRS